VKSIAVGKHPIGIAANPNTNMIYVANYDSNTTSVIDGKTNAVIKNIQTGINPAAIAVNPNTNKIYVVTRSEDEFEKFGVSIIDGKTNGVVKTTVVGEGPISIAFNPNTNTIYEANPGAHTVSVIMTKFPNLR
jgi:YVTN family beta-propeller protein